MKRNYKIPTIFDSVEPFSKEEQKEFNKKRRKEWFERNIGSIIMMAAFDIELKELFIKSFSDNIYESFRREMIEELSKFKGNRKMKWHFGKHKQYIVHYALYYLDAREDGRSKCSEYAFECLASLEGISIDKAGQYLTRARKKVSPDSLPDFARPFHKQQTRKSAKKQK